MTFCQHDILSTNKKYWREQATLGEGVEAQLI